MKKCVKLHKLFTCKHVENLEIENNQHAMIYFGYFEFKLKIHIWGSTVWSNGRNPYFSARGVLGSTPWQQ